MSKSKIILFLLLHAQFLFAQSETQYQNLAVWSVFNTEYFFKNGNLLFYEGSLLGSTSKNSSDLANLPFYRWDNRLAYEYRLNSHWGIGGGLRLISEKSYSTLVSRLYANHSGNIKSLEFVKQIGYERLDYGISGRQAQGRLTFFASLSKNFVLKNTKILRPTLAAEIITVHDYKNNPISENQPSIRNFNFRLELAYFVKENWSLGLFYAQNSDYSFVLAQYNANNQIIRPDRDYSLITPILGLRLHAYFKDKNLDKTLKLRYLSY